MSNLMSMSGMPDMLPVGPLRALLHGDQQTASLALTGTKIYHNTICTGPWGALARGRQTSRPPTNAVENFRHSYYET